MERQTVGQILGPGCLLVIIGVVLVTLSFLACGGPQLWSFLLEQ